MAKPTCCQSCLFRWETSLALEAGIALLAVLPAEAVTIKTLVPFDKPSFRSNVRQVLAEEEATQTVESAVNRYLNPDG